MAPRRKATGTDRLLAELLDALRAAAAGHADVRLSTRRSGMGKDVARAFNDFMDLSTRYNKELVRVSRAIGRDGRTTERIDMGPVSGMWVTRVEAVNALIDDLVRPDQRGGPGHLGGGRGRPDPEDAAGHRRPADEGRVRPHGGGRQLDGRPAVGLRRRGHPGGPRGRHRGPPRRPGPGAGRVGHLAGPHRQREPHGVEPDRPGAEHRPGHHGRGQRRPDPEDHRRRPGRGRRAEGDHQHDGRPAPVVRRRGHPGGPRGRHRRPARRPGRGGRAWPARGRTSPTR